MSRLLYKTRANERPQGKPNVYFTCHPDDFGRYYEEYAGKLLKLHDCAVWYEAEPEAEYDPEDLELHLSQMQLFVIPVTTKLLTRPSRAMDTEFPLAMKKYIPVLPLMMEGGLDGPYYDRFGALQYLDPNDRDLTRRSFDEMLETYVKAVLVGSELAGKVRAAFDAYVFLSYRKKDRKMAQELMRLIHKNPICRDIAIWYDEFLTPGEDFNQAIGAMLEKSDLFALTVTPNLVNEPNYVMAIEYPAALAQNKPILPVEMAKTDRVELEKHYRELPLCVPGTDGEEFRTALMERLKTIAVTANDEDPLHNYLIGLAYLDGIDVEVDGERAEQLITGAAQSGLREAMAQLATMYEKGKGVKRDYKKGVEWRRKAVDALKEAYEAEPTEAGARRYCDGLWNLITVQESLWQLDDAKQTCDEMNELILPYFRKGTDWAKRRMMIIHLWAGDLLSKSHDPISLSSKDRETYCGQILEHYKKALEISEGLAQEKDTPGERSYVSVCYGHLGKATEDYGWDHRAARAYYEKQYAIDEALVQKEGTIDQRLALAVSCSNVAEVLEAIGEYELSKEYFERLRDITEFLANETGTAQSRHNLGVSHMDLGRITVWLRDYEGAMEYLRKGVLVLEPLAAETNTIEDRRALGSCYSNMEDVAERKGDIEQAWEYAQKILAIDEELAAETGTAKARKGLGVIYNIMHRFAKQKNDPELIREYLGKYVSTREEEALKNGGEQALWSVWKDYVSLGDMFRESGDFKTALERYQRAVFFCSRCAETAGTSSAFHALQQIYEKMYCTAVEMGDPEKARHYYDCGKETVLRHAQAAAEIRDREEAAWRLKSLGDCYCEMGELAEKKGEQAEALNCFDKALAAWAGYCSEKAKADDYLYDWFDRVCKAADKAGVPDCADAIYRRFLAGIDVLIEEKAATEQLHERMIACLKLGDRAKKRDELDRAQICYEKGLAVSKALDDREGTVETHGYLAAMSLNLADFCYRQRDEKEKARCLLESVLEIKIPESASQYKIINSAKRYLEQGY